MRRKTLRLLAGLLVLMMVLASCGGGTNSNSSDSQTEDSSNAEQESSQTDESSEESSEAEESSAEESSDSAAEESGGGAGETAGEKVLRVAISDTPTTLSPYANDAEYEMVNDIHATLYREILNPETGKKEWLPELAEGEPEHTEDMKVWTVKMHEGYTFANGDPIDANAFAASFKTLNDPNLANRNITISDLKNGEKFYAGECSWEEVGFRVVDDYTIEFTFEEEHEPASDYRFKANMCWMGTGVVHQPTFEATLNEDGTQSSYGTSVETVMASGLYEPVQIIEGQTVVLQRRTDGGAPMEEYFTPDRVEYVAVSDPNTRVQLFEQGKLSYVVANQDQYASYDGAHMVYTPNNYGIFLNSRTPSVEVLKDVNFRLALYWGLDRDTIVPAVFPTALPSAYQYMPYATMPDPENPDTTVDYRSTEEARAIRIDGHEPTQSGYDKDLALEYFEKAYEANGSTKIEITAYYSDSNDLARTWAEAVQNNWNELFGTDRFELSLQATASATMYEENLARTALKYDIMIAGGWYQDPSDPWENTNWVSDDSPYAYNSQYCIFADDEAQTAWNDLFEKGALGEDKFNDANKLKNCALMEEILYNDCSFIPCYSSGDRYFFGEGIKPPVEEGDWDKLFFPMQTIFE